MGKLAEVRAALLACFQANSEPLTRAQVEAWIFNRYPDNTFNQNTLRAQLYRSCVQNVSTTSAPKVLDYDSFSKTYKLRADVDFSGHQAVSVCAEPDDVTEGESTFALESDLQGYLVKNLVLLEKGLTLWEDSPPSVEYSIAGRRIDILAKDGDGVPVVIEIKLNKGYDTVVGQALLYQALLIDKFRVPRVRILLVANDISTDLRLACSRLSDVDLFEYAITMKIDRVSSVLTEEEVLDVSAR